MTAAHEAITLLKNENNVAPLDLRKIKSIAVIGPNANRSLLGGYSGVPKHEVTVLDGITRESRQEDQGALQRGLQDHHRRKLEPG